MKLIQIFRVISLIFILSNNIFYSRAELQNSVILDNSTGEITIWKSEIAKSIRFFWESIGNGSVKITFVSLDNSNFIFTIPTGDSGSAGSPDVLRISLLLITSPKFNASTTINWEFEEITIIRPATSQNDPNFDLNLDSKLPIIGGTIAVFVIFILGYIYGSQIYNKRKYHGDDLYPSVFEENEKS
ncbi:MAG: hypothetical protein HeimC2_23410 [Candidatus Heimdallarchaeota archaeon LC_2]|nr:MAG: hypothetical protein HeimC2_23410 [Candidatus Heimdallarchaeota archaeon LC_2]